MQEQAVEQWKQSAVNGASATIHQFQDVAQETKREFSAVWRNEDERDDIIRTAAISLGILAVVGILAAITGWMPLWLRLVVVFATIGILGRWLMTKIVDDTD